MLHALDAARGETEAMLDRQREFVAEASHELRTPLTSVLANLELLAEELDGEPAETAQAALRSTRRMRHLVGDLLLLARADAKHAQPHRPTDLRDVLLEVVSELGPVADDHELAISAHSIVVAGVRDELHRMTLNLIENAIRHTPPGTHVRASTGANDGEAVMIVEDDGPGIPPELERRLFERFVRGAAAREARGRDGGRGSGLGLAIVRAVAESHRGSVAMERPEEGVGTRFVIRIPDASSAESRQNEDQQQVVQTSTTTGSTMGRRRSRS
jgi:signal transduction histidine kinase